MTEMASTENTVLPPAETTPVPPAYIPEGTQARSFRRVTIAQGLIILVGILAAILRLSALSTSPLSLEEAEQAYLVWQFWQPGNLDSANTLLGDFLAAGSPAYFTFTSPLLLVLGSSDTVMRLVPAIFGLLTVLLPWFLRKRLGMAGAVVAAFLLAISPLMASISRTAGGDAIAIFAVFLVLVAWLRFQEESRPEWFYMLMTALGLGISSSSLFYSGLLTFTLAIFVFFRFGPGLLPPIRRPDRPTLRNGIIIGGVTFLATSTFFFFNLAGLGAAFTNLGEWFNAFTFQGDLQAWFEPILLILRYEPALLILGLVSLAWATWHGSPFPGLLSYWFAAALFLALLQHNTPENVLILILAGYLLVAIWANSILDSPPEEVPDPSLPVSAGVLRWGLFIILLVIGATIYFNLSRHLRQVAFSTDNIGNLLMVIVALIAGIALVNFVRVWDRRSTNQATLLALLILFGLYSWGTAWWLTHEGAADPRERWISSTTDPGILLMQDILFETSFQLNNAVDTLDVVVAVDNASLRWYMREFDNARFGETIPNSTNTEAIISPIETNLVLSTDYFGADFGLMRHPPQGSNINCPSRNVENLGGATICRFEQILRWWLFHDSPDPIIQDKVILWVRTDLTLGDQ